MPTLSPDGTVSFDTVDELLDYEEKKKKTQGSNGATRIEGVLRTQHRTIAEAVEAAKDSRTKSWTAEAVKKVNNLLTMPQAAALRVLASARSKLDATAIADAAKIHKKGVGPTLLAIANRSAELKLPTPFTREEEGDSITFAITEEYRSAAEEAGIR